LKSCVTRDLDQPIEWIGLVGLPGPSKEEKERWLREAVNRVHRERCRKLELLKTELGLRTGPFGDFPLAMWLATEYVRGFRLLHPDDRRRRGRRRDQWPHGQYIGLLVDVDQIKEVSRVRTNRAALRVLVSRPNDYFDGATAPIIRCQGNAGTKSQRTAVRGEPLRERKRIGVHVHRRASRFTASRVCAEVSRAEMQFRLTGSKRTSPVKNKTRHLPASQNDAEDRDDSQQR
jgi:hypothetical protein